MLLRGQTQARPTFNARWLSPIDVKAFRPKERRLFCPRSRALAVLTSIPIAPSVPTEALVLYFRRSTPEISPSSQQQDGEISVGKTLEIKGLSVRGEIEHSSRVSTAEMIDFIKAQVRRRRAKEVQRLTGLSIKAIENMRMGLSGASSQTITTWCRNDPEFRAAYFAECGGLLEGDPEMLSGLTRAVNAYM